VQPFNGQLNPFSGTFAAPYSSVRPFHQSYAPLWVNVNACRVAGILKRPAACRRRGAMYGYSSERL
jgi:hypothetical protein